MEGCQGFRRKMWKTGPYGKEEGPGGDSRPFVCLRPTLDQQAVSGGPLSAVRGDKPHVGGDLRGLNRRKDLVAKDACGVGVQERRRTTFLGAGQIQSWLGVHRQCLVGLGRLPLG